MDLPVFECRYMSIVAEPLYLSILDAHHLLLARRFRAGWGAVSISGIDKGYCASYTFILAVIMLA